MQWSCESQKLYFEHMVSLDLRIWCFERVVEANVAQLERTSWGQNKYSKRFLQKQINWPDTSTDKNTKKKQLYGDPQTLYQYSINYQFDTYSDKCKFSTFVKLKKLYKRYINSSLLSYRLYGMFQYLTRLNYINYNLLLVSFL